MFDMLTAIVAAYAGYVIWSMQRIGLILGLIFATASAGRWFLFVPGVPLWSLTMVVLWILVVYGLIRDRKHFEPVAYGLAEGWAEVRHRKIRFVR